MSEPTTPRGPRPAEEVFAERVAPLLELVERWRARVGTEAERWPAVPRSGLEPDDPRRLGGEIAGGRGGGGGRGAPWWRPGGGEGARRRYDVGEAGGLPAHRALRLSPRRDFRVSPRS